MCCDKPLEPHRLKGYTDRSRLLINLIFRNAYNIAIGRGANITNIMLVFIKVRTVLLKN